MEKTVITKYGKVEGFEEEGLLKFLGIPFAQQPKGDLKWKRARECEKWDGVLEAKAYGDVAPQFNAEKWQGSLDCLSINVVRPKEGEKLPVFVWIHGGGFSIGGCNDSLYAGTKFAQDGCIYVSFQYRLSVYGFYEFCKYPGCENVETNRGLSDMIMAMKWIHENIAAFGGNPQNVTIAGESAGGSAVTTLMAVPSVKGYFNRVIAESSLCDLVDTLESQKKKVDIFAEKMGLTDENFFRTIDTMDPYELIAGHLYVEGNIQYTYPGICNCGPVIDDLLPEKPIDAIEKGCAKDIDLIIGTNLNEGTLFVRPEGTTFPNSWELIEKCFELNGISDKYPAFHSLYEGFENEKKYGSAFVKFATDVAWEVPSVKLAMAQRNFAKTYMYRFEYLSKFGLATGMLASHAFELPCVFGEKKHEFAAAFFDGESEEDKNAVIDLIHGEWIRFAKGGEPSEKWPKFEGEIPPVYIFARDSKVENLDRRELMETWKDVRLYQ